MQIKTSNLFIEFEHFVSYYCHIMKLIKWIIFNVLEYSIQKIKKSLKVYSANKRAFQKADFLTPFYNMFFPLWTYKLRMEKLIHTIHNLAQILNQFHLETLQCWYFHPYFRKINPWWSLFLWFYTVKNIIDMTVVLTRNRFHQAIVLRRLSLY